MRVGMRVAAVLAVTGAALGAQPAAAQRKMTDANILAHEMAANRGEVALGQYMAAHGGTAAVRAYGATLARDHAAGLASTRRVATRAGVTPRMQPGDDIAEESARALRHIRSLRGAARDTAFVNHAVSDHREDIEDANRMARDATRAAVRQLVAGTLPELRRHLQRAEALQGSLAQHGGAHHR